MRTLRLTLITLGLLLASGVQAASFQLAPSTSFKAGCPENITIFMGTAGASTDAANILVNYNPAEVDILDARSGTAGIQIQPGSTFDSYADNLADPSTGVIRLTGFTVGGSYNSGSGSGVFATIPLRSKPGVTSTALSIQYTPGETLDSNIAEVGTSVDLLTSVTNQTYSFVSAPCVADTQAPRVVSTTPSNGATGVALSSPITFRMTDNQAGIDFTSVSVQVLGVTYTQTGTNQWTRTGTALDSTFTVIPVAPFPDGAEVVVRVDAKDLDNNVMGQYRFSFNRPPTPPPPTPTCESLGCFSAPQVCPAVPPSVTPPVEAPVIPPVVPGTVPTLPAETVSGGERIGEASLVLYGLGGTLALPREADTSYSVYTGMRYSVHVEAAGLAGAELVAATGTYAMRSGATWVTEVLAPAVPGVYRETAVLTHASGAVEHVPYLLRVLPPSRVLGADNTGVPATVTVLNAAGEVWDGSAVGQMNPVRTGSAGDFSPVLPPGSYTLRIDASGYMPRSVAVRTERAVVSEDVQVYASPVAAVQAEGVRAVPVLAEAAAEAVREQVPVLAPVVTGVAVANAVALAGAAGLLQLGGFLQFLFTQPVLLLGRRKRKQWGTVYDSLTHMPLAYATVRLRDFATGSLLQTRVTDASGRYFFTVQQGMYRIEVQKTGYAWPSVFAAQVIDEPQFGRVYHGEALVIGAEGGVITAALALDPADKPLVADSKVVLRAWLRRAQYAVAFLGVLSGVVAYLVQPSGFTLGLLLAQIVLFWVCHRIARGGKARGYGLVYDATTHQPLAHTVVRLFSAQYNKLLETTVTDAQGRYSFVVGPETYVLSATQQGYAEKRESLTLRGDGALIVSHSLALKKA